MPYRVLQARRNELSRQLNSAEGRREELLRELSRAPEPAVRAGIESRLRLLDERILSIEQQIAENGRQLAQNPGVNTSTSEPPSLPWRGARGAAPVMAFLLIGSVIYAIMSRTFRRGTRASARREAAESDARLERIEQAVDAIAIEIERVAEAQRFQTKLLQEGAAGMQPLKLPEGDAVGGWRSGSA